MTRDEAKELVAPFIVYQGEYQSVQLKDAKSLLGDERFERLLHDPIRRLGPAIGTVYPWNVVDYLAQPDLRKEPPCSA
jgi:hypothetical protein